jgi:hypothetical protein
MNGGYGGRRTEAAEEGERRLRRKANGGDGGNGGYRGNGGYGGNGITQRNGETETNREEV